MLAELRKSDAILLGAVGTPDVPPGVLERGLLLRLRFELDLYVNLRPSKLRPGVGGAVGKHRLEDLDFVIVRENTEGLYAGAGGTVHRGTEFETATEESLNTWAGVRRCVTVRGQARGAAVRPAHAGAQDQRADARGRPVAPHRHGGRRGGGRAARLRARRRGVPVDGRRPRQVRRDRHRQPVRRHHLRPGRGADRRSWLRAERQPEPGPHRAVGVRAGARLGAGHRRQGPGQSGRGRAVGRADALPSGRGRGGGGPGRGRGRGAGRGRAGAARGSGRRPLLGQLGQLGQVGGT